MIREGNGEKGFKMELKKNMVILKFFAITSHSTETDLLPQIWKVFQLIGIMKDTYNEINNIVMIYTSLLAKNNMELLALFWEDEFDLYLSHM